MYRKDLIEEKNQKNKMKRSIVKFWNVSYGTPEVVGPPEAFSQSGGDGEDGKIERILQEKDVKLKELIEHEREETESGSEI